LQAWRLMLISDVWNNLNKQTPLYESE